MQPDPPASGPRPGRKQSLLLALERFSRRRYGVIFALALVAVVGGSWLGTRLHLESDILALVPEGNPHVDTFREAVDDFGSISHLFVLFEATGDAGPDELEELADAYAERLAAREALVEKIEYRLEDRFDMGGEFLELFYDNALLFLPPGRLEELEARLTDEAIRAQLAENRLQLNSPTATFTQELMLNDPLGLMPLLLERLAATQGPFRVDLSSGTYLSTDGRMLVMLVTPTAPWQDLEFNERLMREVREAEREARATLDRDVPVEIAFGGHYAIAVDEARLIRQDVRFNLLFSLFAVSTLYFICYRRFAALLYSSVPLLVGQALTFGLAFFVLAELNAASSAFTALLMGLGTDFVIVMYARYVEERRLGRSLAEATERMVGETGLGVFTGAITSAGTFYAMCISEFRGLRDLGFLIGSGILLCAVAIVFLVPAMIKWNEGVRPRKVDAVQKLHVQSFLLERLIPLSARHRTAVILVVALATAGSAWLATRLEFDDSVQVLRSENSPAYDVQRKIAETFGASLSSMMAIAEGRTYDEAIERTSTIDERLAPFVEGGTVSGRSSVLDYLPPEREQREVLARVAAAGPAFDPARIRGAFLAGLEEQGFNRRPFEPFLERLGRFLAPGGTVGLDELEARGLGSLVERFVASGDDGRVRVVTYLSMSDRRWKREPPPGLVEALSAGDSGIVVTGTNVVSREFRRIFSREAPRAVLLGLAVVIVLLLVDFRSVRLTAIALVQLVSGVIMMLGAMKLADIHLNYVNAFVATMILGVGIDYSIHMVHRMSLTGGRVEDGLLETGKAVVIAALTNCAAFGTLMLGNYPALRSFGQVALIGSLTCLLTSLTLVPAMMVRRKTPDA